MVTFLFSTLINLPTKKEDDMHLSRSMNRLWPSVIICGILGLAFLLIALPGAMAQQQSLEEIYEAAKEEGLRGRNRG